jgi:hypothetical protein
VILKPFLLAKTEGGRAWKCIGNFKKKIGNYIVIFNLFLELCYHIQ